MKLLFLKTPMIPRHPERRRPKCPSKQDPPMAERIYKAQLIGGQLRLFRLQFFAV